MTLARYLLKNFIPTFLFALAVLTFVSFMGQFTKIFNVALVKGIPLAWVGECFMLVLPNFLADTVPIAFLVALMMTLGHLAETGELLALRASGFSPGQVLWPFLIVAAVLSSGLLELNHESGPAGWNKFKNMYAAAVSKVASVDPEPRTFSTLGQWKLYSNDVDRAIGGLTDVHLFRYKNESMSTTVTAKTGRYKLKPGQGIDLILFDGDLVRPGTDDPTRIVRAHFDEYDLFVPFGADVDLKREPIPTELTTAKIDEKLRGSLEPGDRWELTTEAVSRSAESFTPLVFLCAAWPLALRLEKRGRAIGLALSLAILFAYYGLVMLGVSLGRKGLWQARLAPWAGDAACVGVGAALAALLG
jgi:lipopolysaccharide export LptBFGC system permease protein LptF